jgi:hypothetical protein
MQCAMIGWLHVMVNHDYCTYSRRGESAEVVMRMASALFAAQKERTWWRVTQCVQRKHLTVMTSREYLVAWSYDLYSKVYDRHCHNETFPWVLPGKWPLGPLNSTPWESTNGPLLVLL